MGARRKGRELAVQALYQLELRDESTPETLRLFWEQCGAGGRAREFATELVAGVQAERPTLDALIATACEHWRLERLSRVDRNVLRLATYELRRAQVPTSVVIDEAIEIARRFGSEESAQFVNGILDAVAARLGVKPPARSVGEHG